MLEQRLAKMEKILLSPEAKKQKTMLEQQQQQHEEEDFDDEYDDNLAGRGTSTSTDGQAPLSVVSAGSSSHTLPAPPVDDYSYIPNNNSNTSTSTTTINNNSATANKKYKINYGKRSSEDNHNGTSPTSYSSISSNFPSPPPHMLTHQRSRSNEISSSDLLPPMDVIQHIVDLYFTYLFAAVPIFDENTLRSDVKERKCSDFLLLSLLATCARYIKIQTLEKLTLTNNKLFHYRFSDRPDITENPAWHAGEKYAEKARTMIIQAVDEPNMSNLQALTLLCLHEYGCGRGPR
jgi:hypothetical protein